MFSLAGQVAPPVPRLGAVLAMFADRLIESGLRLFNSLLAFCSIIRMCRWRRGNKTAARSTLWQQPPFFRILRSSSIPPVTIR